MAVLDSFKKAGAAIVNHHTLVQNKTLSGHFLARQAQREVVKIQNPDFFYWA